MFEAVGVRREYDENELNELEDKACLAVVRARHVYRKFRNCLTEAIEWLCPTGTIPQSMPPVSGLQSKRASKL